MAVILASSSCGKWQPTLVTGVRCDQPVQNWLNSELFQPPKVHTGQNNSRCSVIVTVSTYVMFKGVLEKKLSLQTCLPANCKVCSCCHFEIAILMGFKLLWITQLFWQKLSNDWASCFLVSLSTTYLQTAMIWSHSVLLGFYHGLFGTFCSSLKGARRGIHPTLGKRWAGTQMQGLRDWSRIPTVATKADICVKQNQIKKNLAKRQRKTKQQRNRSQYPYMPFCALHPGSIFQNFQMSRAWVSPSFPLQSSPHLWRIFPPPSHVLWPLCSSRHIRKNLQVGSIVRNFIHFDIPKWCEHKHRYRLFF